MNILHTQLKNSAEKKDEGLDEDEKIVKRDCFSQRDHCHAAVFQNMDSKYF